MEQSVKWGTHNRRIIEQHEVVARQKQLLVDDPRQQVRRVAQQLQQVASHELQVVAAAVQWRVHQDRRNDAENGVANNTPWQQEQ